MGKYFIPSLLLLAASSSAAAPLHGAHVEAVEDSRGLLSNFSSTQPNNLIESVFVIIRGSVRGALINPVSKLIS